MKIAGNFEIKSEGVRETQARIRGRAEVAHHRLKRLTENAASRGAMVMRGLVPVDTGYTRRHIESDEATWHPGGAGGGGYWETNFGVVEGHSRHPLWLYEGTGLFKNMDSLSGFLGGYNYIRPATGNIMVFEYNGRTIFTNKVKGQKPQTEWVEQGQDAADEYVARHLAMVYAEHGLS